MSLTAVGVWLGGIALHIRSTFRLQLFAPSSYVPCRRFRRIDNGEELAKFSSSTATHANCQARWDVQPHYRCLYNATYTQGPRQCYRRSRGRWNASPDHVHWTSATYTQELNWYMAIALPAGNTERFLHLILEPEPLVVYNLVSVGLDRRDTSCGQSASVLHII